MFGVGRATLRPGGALHAAALVALAIWLADVAAARATAQGSMPPNMSRVTAIVARHTTYPPGALPPPVNRSAPYYSLTLDVTAAAAARPDMDSFARPGVVEVFSRQPVPTHLDGHRVEVVMSLLGEDAVARWVLLELRRVD